jgi:hypothetical protein
LISGTNIREPTLAAVEMAFSCTCPAGGKVDAMLLLEGSDEVGRVFAPVLGGNTTIAGSCHPGGDMISNK